VSTASQKPKRHRNSCKAIIIRDGCALLVRNVDEEGNWFLLPGGGQEHGESLHEAVRRECLEEIGTDVGVGRLRFIREYIGAHHEFAEHDAYLHQVELMFECTVPDDYSPGNGHAPDPVQAGVDWVPLDQLAGVRLYPSVLRELLRDGIDAEAPVYLGDVN
jgi:8-oxo-dGTP pyrophosphatase MutT (NUDIX family)